MPISVFSLAQAANFIADAENREAGQILTQLRNSRNLMEASPEKGPRGAMLISAHEIIVARTILALIDAGFESARLRNLVDRIRTGVGRLEGEKPVTGLTALLDALRQNASTPWALHAWLLNGEPSGEILPFDAALERARAWSSDRAVSFHTLIPISAFIQPLLHLVDAASNTNA